MLQTKNGCHGLVLLVVLVVMGLAFSGCVSRESENPQGDSGAGGPQESPPNNNPGEAPVDNDTGTPANPIQLPDNGGVTIPDNVPKIPNPDPAIAYNTTAQADVTATLVNCEQGGAYQFEQVNIQHAFELNSENYSAQLKFVSSQHSRVLNVLLHDATINANGDYSGRFSALMNHCGTQTISRGDISGHATATEFSGALAGVPGDSAQCGISMSVNLNLAMEESAVSQPNDCGTAGSGSGGDEPSDTSGGSSGGGSDAGGGDTGNDNTQPPNPLPLPSSDNANLIEEYVGTVTIDATRLVDNADYSMDWALNAANLVYVWLNKEQGYYLIVIDMPNAIQTVLSGVSGENYTCRCLPMIEQIDGNLRRVTFNNLLLSEADDFDGVDDFVQINGELVVPDVVVTATP